MSGSVRSAAKFAVVCRPRWVPNPRSGVVRHALAGSDPQGHDRMHWAQRDAPSRWGCLQATVMFPGLVAQDGSGDQCPVDTLFDTLSDGRTRLGADEMPVFSPKIEYETAPGGH